MAGLPKTQISTSDNITLKQWSFENFYRWKETNRLKDYVGTGSNSVFQLKTELQKKTGDKITIKVFKPLKEDPVVGNDTVEGREEELSWQDFSLTIEEGNKPIGTGGKMEKQRIPDDLKQVAKYEGTEFMNIFFEKMLLNHLCGVTTYRVDGKTFAQNPVAADTNHKMFVGGHTAATSLTAADTCNLGFLDQMKQRANTLNTYADGCFKIRKASLKGGKQGYLVLMHDYAFDQMKRNFSMGEWGSILVDSKEIGLDPGEEFWYNGMLVKKLDTMPTYQGATITSNAGAYYVLFLGAQSACVAYGGAGDNQMAPMMWVPYMTDADRFVNIRMEFMMGVKAVSFDSPATGTRFGSIVGGAWAAPLAS